MLHNTGLSVLFLPSSSPPSCFLSVLSDGDVLFRVLAMPASASRGVVQVCFQAVTCQCPLHPTPPLLWLVHYPARLRREKKKQHDIQMDGLMVQE